MTNTKDSKNDYSRYQQIFENNQTVKIIINPDNGNIVECNQAAVSFYGYDKNTLTSLNISDINSLSSQATLDTFNKIKHKKMSHFQTQHRIASGEMRDIEAYPCTIETKEGVLIYVLIFDITERLKNEKTLLYFELMVSDTTDFLVLLDKNNIFLTANNAYLNAFNKTASDIIGTCALELWGKKIFNKDIKDNANKAIAGETVNYQRWVELPALGLRYLEGTYSPYYLEDGTINGYLATIRDTTEQRTAVEKLMTHSAIITNMTEGAFLTRVSDDIIVYNNPAFEALFGYAKNELIGQHVSILNISGTNKNKATDQLIFEALLNNKEWHGEVRNVKKDGSIFWCLVNVTCYNHPEFGEVYVSINTDITQDKINDEKILHLAHYDNLTNLPNRFLVLDRLTQMINDAERNQEKIAVIFLDLDDFKKVNDTLGHDVGDKLLIQASERLNKVIRSKDTVGRLGGDEFIVLLGGLKSESDAQPIAENLLQQFQNAFLIDGRELILTASIGLSIYPENGSSASELLRSSDSAMYHAKDQGRNAYYYYTDEMSQKVSRRLEIEEQLYEALKRNELDVFYQPKINLSNKKIMGAEALLRWNNPKLGHVSPSEFIPIAEQTGLIVAIGEFVLQRALQQSAQWQKIINNFSMAINLSPRQFRDGQLINTIQKALSKTSFNVKNLELEITEGVLMSGHKYMEKAIAAISEMGINIAMDDFGTGYSSLSYLRRYPFNILKIDQSFIRDICIDSKDRALIIATIAMAHGLNLKVVAEGVETVEQYKELKELNCDFAQGYLFSKPLAVDEFFQLISAEA